MDSSVTGTSKPVFKCFFSRFHWVFTELYYFLLGLARFSWVLLDFTGFLLDDYGFYWVLLLCTGFIGLFLDCTVFYRVSSGLDHFFRFSWVIIGLSGFYWAFIRSK